MAAAKLISVGNLKNRFTKKEKSAILRRKGFGIPYSYEKWITGGLTQ